MNKDRINTQTKELKKRFRNVAISTKNKMAEREHISPVSKWAIVRMQRVAELIVKKERDRNNARKERLDYIKDNIGPEKYNDKKYVKELYDDIVFCRSMYGFSDQEYFTYEVDKLSHKGRQQFVTMRGKYHYYYKFNNQNYIMYLNKKTEMYRKYRKYYGRDAFCIYDETDRDGFLEFVAKHPKFIYKPSDDSGGRGIEILDLSTVKNPTEIFDILLSQGCGIVEELIEQGQELAQFHPDSINTIRVVTFLNDEGKTEILWSFLRMGMGGNHTDNMSSGGLSAMIDPENGIIYSAGRDWKGDECVYHPDTHVQLVGFKIPEWDKAKELINEVALVIPQIRFVGWDIAYSTKGWVLIEGNSRPQCLSAQIPKYNGKLAQFRELEKKIDAK